MANERRWGMLDERQMSQIKTNKEALIVIDRLRDYVASGKVKVCYIGDITQREVFESYIPSGPALLPGEIQSEVSFRVVKSPAVSSLVDDIVMSTQYVTTVGQGVE